MKTKKHTVRERKIPKGLDPAIVENILWFSRFTPLEKIRYYERQRKRVKRFKGLALRCIKNISSKKY